MKDKITKEQEIEKINEQVNKKANIENKLQIAIENNNKIAEAIAALQVLGYNKKEIEKVFAKLDKNELSTEELIKKGLTLLGK